MLKKVMILFVFLLSLAPPAFARSYSMEEVKIRAWIQPDGDLLVNEIFTYEFDGEYDRVNRTVHKENHKGVELFEAYELVNPKVELGYVKMDDLRPLEVEQEENTYHAVLPAKDEKKSVFYIYELKGAVKSYESYSDLTVPFFGTDTNHDEDLPKVTIDFVFPEEIRPNSYVAFFHDRQGKVEEKGPWVVRFTTPVSQMYSLTETRLLFPSSLMSEQTKTRPPMSLKEAIAEEEKLADKNAALKKQLNMLRNVLTGFAALLAFVVMAVFFTRFLRKLRTADRPDELLRTDPLTLYMIHRRGKQNPYAFLAGVYSLVEKGKATVRTEQNAGRFLKDESSADQSLYFTLTASETSLSTCEQKLVSWLFRRKSKNGSPVFFMSDVAGASSQLRNNPQHLHNFHSKYKLFKEYEKQWFACVVNEMKEAGMMSDKMIGLAGRGLMLINFLAVIYAYYLDSLSTTAIVIYSVFAGFLLTRGWLKPARRLFILLFYLVSFIAGLMLYDTDILTVLIVTVVLSGLLYLVTPRMTLSEEASVVQSEIQSFIKQIKSGRFHDKMAGQSDQWTIRTLLLKPSRKSRISKEEYIHDDRAAAPLTYLVASGQEPVEFLTNTWKWSIPPGSSSSSSVSGDSGGYSGGGDSGGGSDGGGAGAD
ncbi:DUF2207 domain-containing protein [Bacillus sp. ISL-35]|uniref:DUF2207 domain-containing protein n=1 Tax=Bacillus sp. ISL-35 TaxID=2819122 RepID=UPI001BE8B6EB|nr:DUF2207 domain-containing protein [Bacillus sp. ISL-35]MBT2704242.1 DUF2207 domain-containing protein [Chryseobacterium sp. ISL-80]